MRTHPPGHDILRVPADVQNAHRRSLLAEAMRELGTVHPGHHDIGDEDIDLLAQSPTCLQRVNLAVNARDAMPAGGTLTVAVQNVKPAIATAFTWRRMAPLTVGEARRLGFEARKAPNRGG